jgi:hypothetical protein
MRGIMLVLLAAMMVVSVAIPVIAQDDVQDYRDYVEPPVQDYRDYVEPPVEGDYAAQCVPALQFGNTGNFGNTQGFVQYGSTEPEPSTELECEPAP